MTASLGTRKLQHPIEVFWSAVDKGYIAAIPDLPGFSAWGATETEAINEARDAIIAWLKAARAAGNTIAAR